MDIFNKKRIDEQNKRINYLYHLVIALARLQGVKISDLGKYADQTAINTVYLLELLKENIND